MKKLIASICTNSNEKIFNDIIEYYYNIHILSENSYESSKRVL